MKNFEIWYPVEGANALSPRTEKPCREAGRIIVFPGGRRQQAAHAVRSSAYATLDAPGSCLEVCEAHLPYTPRHASSGKNHLGARGAHAEPSPKELFFSPVVEHSLRSGSIQGIPFGGVSRLQTAAVALVFAGIAFAALFLSL